MDRVIANNRDTNKHESRNLNNMFFGLYWSQNTSCSRGRRCLKNSYYDWIDFVLDGLVEDIELAEDRDIGMIMSR